MENDVFIAGRKIEDYRRNLEAKEQQIIYLNEEIKTNNLRAEKKLQDKEYEIKILKEKSSNIPSTSPRDQN